MIKLRIEKIDGFKYHLKDHKDKVYSLKLGFYDLPRELKKGDLLYMHEKYVRDKNTFWIGYNKLDKKNKDMIK